MTAIATAAIMVVAIAAVMAVVEIDVNPAIPLKAVWIAAVFFGLFSFTVAQAALPAAERVHSLREFNRIIERLRPVYIYTVEAHVIAIEYPLCASNECPPAFMLISDTPKNRMVNEKVQNLINQFPLYDYNQKAMENMLEETQSGYAFRVLSVEGKKRLEPGKRYRLRIRASNDTRRYRSGFVLEDFCIKPDCGKWKTSSPFADARVYSLGEFNRLRATQVAYTVEGYVVWLAYPQCKPGGYCPPCTALISDTPPSRITEKKLWEQIHRFTVGYTHEVETALNEIQSAHAFRALDLNLNLQAGKELKQTEPETRFRLRIRVNSNDAGNFLAMEDFCALPDCAGAQQ